MRELAALLRRTLKRIRTITEDFHLVLHTSPNSQHQSETLGYWKTIDDDYHWHIEILPVIASQGEVVHVQRSLLFAGDLGDCGEAAAGRCDRGVEACCGGALRWLYNGLLLGGF